ncbi:hypothetical protein ACIBG7_35890 [Nonomuraea sp. NPDC050328]|uniref:hypothetical protein n=1 Tax=Nonomuraea sp. NPDC050328 TaxID=3364361 RepID=UPI0037B2E351
MSSAHGTLNSAVKPTGPDAADTPPDHRANAQWLKDNPAALPQVSAGRWAVYDRAGQLRGHLVGDGPTRDTRFRAIAISKPQADEPDGAGITLHDAGAHLLDTAE